MLYKAETEIKRILKVIKCQMYRPGKLYSDVLNACTEKAFLGITVTNSKIPLINKTKKHFEESDQQCDVKVNYSSRGQVTVDAQNPLKLGHLRR